MDQHQPLSASEQIPTLAASYECRRRFGRSIRIDVDGAGIARTDKSGWRHLRWAEVRLLTRPWGQVVALMDASRQHTIAIPRKTENLHELLTSIEERLADAHTARLRPGSRKPARAATYRQRRWVALSLVITAATVATVCAWLRPYYYVDAMISLVSMLGYLATLPNSVVLGPDHVEIMTPVMSTRVPIRAIREVRLLVLADRGPTIMLTMSGVDSVELRGFGDGAVFLYDMLRQVMDPGDSLEYIPAQQRVSPRRAVAFVTASMALVAVLIGLPIWNGRALSAGIRFLSPRFVGALLAIGASTEGRDEDGRTATYNAAKYGRIEALRLVLAHGGNPAARSHNGPGHTPLHVAAEYNQLESVRALLAAGADPNVRNNWAQTPLEQLIMLGKRTPVEPPIVHALLDAGADLNAQDMQGLTVFHASVEHPETADIVRMLLAARPNVNLNLAARDRYTAFGLAVHKRSWAIARQLAEAGARLDDNELDDNTWLRKGVGRPDEELVRHMIDYGARLDVIAEDDLVPIQAAAYFGHTSIVEMLIAAGADVNVGTRFAPALNLTIRQRHLETARVLIKHGASPDLASEGWTMLQTAAYQNDLELVKLLVEAGADMTKSAPAAPPALLLASERGHIGVVRALLDAGADVNTAFGPWTALTIASVRHRDAVRALLVQRGGQ